MKNRLFAFPMLPLSVAWDVVLNKGNLFVVPARVLLSVALFAILLPTSIGKVIPNNLVQNSDLDDLPWYVDYVEGSPTWIVSNVSDPYPSLDGNSLQCALTGGAANSNIHCYHDLPADPGSNTFTLNISFYYRPPSTFNNVGGTSIVQALEFTMSKWSDEQRYEWALQWDNVNGAGDTGAPKWRYWGREDPTNVASAPQWIDLGISGSLVGERWYTLELKGEIRGGKVHYQQFTLDDRKGHLQTHSLQIPDIVPVPAPGWPNKMSIAVQLDGNKDANHPLALTPYEVFLDQVNFTYLTNADTTGVFRPSNGLLYLKNSNTTGFADTAINYGVGGDYPVVGDWDGNGTSTIGIFRNGSFYLRNSNTIGFADLVFPFGQVGDQPIAGDWDADGVDTIGVYRPVAGQFLLRNSNNAGAAEMSFYLGNVGDVGIAGDWDGDGKDTTGVFRPTSGVIFLKNTNSTGFADIALNYGVPGDKPVVGDWDKDGIDSIGVYRNGTFYLRNSNTIGFADIVFGLGIPRDIPIAGNWDGLP